MLVQDLPHFFEGMAPIHGEGRATSFKTQERDSGEKSSQVQWHTPVILAFQRLRQEHHEFGASAVNIVRSCLKSLES